MPFPRVGPNIADPTTVWRGEGWVRSSVELEPMTPWRALHGGRESFSLLPLGVARFRLSVGSPGVLGSPDVHLPLHLPMGPRWRRCSLTAMFKMMRTDLTHQLDCETQMIRTHSTRSSKNLCNLNPPSGSSYLLSSVSAIWRDKTVVASR